MTLAIYFSIGNLFQVTGYVPEIIIAMVSILLAEQLLSYWRKPKFIFSTEQKGDKLGFSVKVQKKNVIGAKVRCDGKAYSWDDENKAEEKNLYVGDAPSSFFPFQVIVDYVEDTGNEGKEELAKAIIIAVREITTQKVFYGYCVLIRPQASQMFLSAISRDKPLYNVSIRIIGEGIEEVRDYSLYVGLDSLSIPVIKEGKPLMDHVSYSFEAKKKSLFRWKI